MNFLSNTDQALSLEQRQHFLEHGYIKLEQVTPREAALSVVERQFAEEDIDPSDSSTWKQPNFRIQGRVQYDIRTDFPRLWTIVCELLGGEDRIGDGMTMSDMLIVNAFHPTMTRWREPADNEGWHKDGQFFRHFLDSPEQGLLGIFLWSDISPQGGGTFIAPDSIGVVARYLAQHPEGVHPNRLPSRELMAQCPRRIEATGQAGDVYLLHPYMLHCKSHNPHRRLRCISNPLWALCEPMCFDRPERSDHSLVEQAVLQGLGATRYTFTPTHPA